jgi:O-antigen/teichoic acid export membrane protein
MGASYIYNPLLGSFSSLYSEGNIKKLMLLLGKATLGILAIGIVSAVILVFIGSPLLAFLYGSDITAYLYLINPLIACSLIIAYVWFLNDLFVSFRLFKYSFLSNILSLILSLALTIPFVNAFSMNGVSFVGIVGYGATAILMVIFLEKALSAKAQKQP